jgi:hypothetical protein
MASRSESEKEPLPAAFSEHPKISPTDLKNADCGDEESVLRAFALHSPICSEVEVSDRECCVARSIVLSSV